MFKGWAGLAWGRGVGCGTECVGLRHHHHLIELSLHRLVVKVFMLIDNLVMYEIFAREN